MSKQNRIHQPAIGTRAMAFVVLAAAVGTPAAKAEDTGPRTIGIFGEAGLHQTRAVPQIVAGPRLIDVLEHNKDGVAIAWTNAQTGITYRIQPERSFKTGATPCRTFTVRRVSDEEIIESYRTACRDPQGSWQVIGTADPAAPMTERRP